MGAWVTCYRVPPPTNEVILVRFGASVFFAAKSKWFNKWFLCANGRNEEIEAPSLWYCDDESLLSAASNEGEKMNMPPAERINFRKSSRPKQLAFEFSDSVSLSHHRRCA